jgi:predicted DNA-binding transcriptional regulator AlpA
MSQPSHGSLPASVLPSEPAVLEPLLKVDDLKRLYRLSGRSIARLVRAGRLPKPVKLGGGNRWLASQIRQHLAGL